LAGGSRQSIASALRALGFASYCVFWGALMLSFAIDLLPWRMRKHSAQDD
jgi:hypothetical protein